MSPKPGPKPRPRLSEASDGTAVHVVTFVTKGGQRCYYATRTRRPPHGRVEPPALPPHVKAQLDAMQARVAWWVVAQPTPLRYRGDGADACPPVETPAQLEHLVFESVPTDRFNGPNAA